MCSSDLTESPIDAMSLAVVDKERPTQQGVTIYLSSDGSGGIPQETLKAVLGQGGRVITAFDADQAGELMSWRLAQQLPRVERLTPNQGKDWNEQLTLPETSCADVHSNFDNGLTPQLWQWHLAAKTLGKIGRASCRERV